MGTLKAQVIARWYKREHKYLQGLDKDRLY